MIIVLFFCRVKLRRGDLTEGAYATLYTTRALNAHWRICMLGMLLVITAYIFTFVTGALFAFVFKTAYTVALLTFAPDGG